MAVRDLLIAAGAVTGLLALVASFMGVKIDDPPPQHTSPITGFPTWHQTYKNEVKEITMSFTMLALLFATGAAYAARQAIRRPSRSLTGFVTLSTGNEEASTQINQFILYYINATWIAVLGYLFFDVGKIWAVVGALHNLLEVALIVVLQSGGRVSSMSFGLYMFSYVCITILLSVYLPWPLDAIFFRWQGLCSDFALIVFFVRMYNSTKRQLAAFGDPNRHDIELAKAQKAADRLAQQQEEQQRSGTTVSSSSLQSVNLTQPNSTLPTTDSSRTNPLHELHAGWKKFVARAPLPEHNTQQSANGNASLTPGSAHEARFAGEPAHVIDFVPAPSNGTNGHANGGPTYSVVALNQDASIWGMQWRNPEQLLLLVAASIVHVIGNCVTTIWITSTYAMAAFHISYGVSYPLYAYYLYVDNHALRQTKVYFPEYTKLKNITVAALALIGATGTIRAGLFVSSHAKNGGAF
ncbi:hypothetical protein BC939DRAFT_450077 [Gamsiella multidivaricata]|uniref:uncharacterized protein n=1 Tax=Gamsiella multidivaricata TaxID=101098 RepID=UPI002220EAD7|nr:uncharacterized protein BC939DRAFT_450077 [Gamsiella multidivaricata]KAG0367428.1 hypothetical protein BGZ54_003885 [Gamsiella multidivaricata]KAI7824333.1 hypothetical protein BC939DRAFT_450077 [Gamsiella multidivaricata]